MAEAHALRQCMVRDLAERGELDEQWRAVFIEVARHAFLPELVWRQDRDAEGDCDLVPLRRAEDPQRWLELAYANASVITQVDDGHPAGEDGCGFEVASSASMPAVVAHMLTALQVEPGMRVLEIGTGTGYNAALLAHRLGAPNVVSVEIDSAVAKHARAALAAEGYGALSVITGDGADGYPAGAPYDRVICTAAAARVPYAWVAQTNPGGLVLTPWGTAYYLGGLLALTVNHDGTATGKIVAPASFMWLRAHRIPRYTIGQIPQCQKFYHAHDSDTGTLYLVDQHHRSWATLHITTKPPYEVRQGGQRKLWDEVETTYRWWIDIGEPTVNAWKFTITPRDHQIELY